ncbi:MAG TPA: AMP-dependent synthetase, partial [Actinoplanes sp.]
DVLGEIEVRGESLAAGYLHEDGTEELFGGVLRTGDAGFVHGGDLFVVGRLGDAVKQFGRWYFAEDAEQVAIAHSPRPRQTVALVGALTGRNTAAVLVEGNLDGVAEGIGRAVARHVDGLRVIVLAVRSGDIKRTTSGKAKRRAMWGQLAGGELGAKVCWDSDVTAAETCAG